MTHERAVLVVDDDPDIRHAIRSLLEDEGYRVVDAANGEEALEQLRLPFAPCLILLDLMMPVMDGLMFLEHHAADPALSAIPVVVVTAGNRKAAELQGKLVLPKPLRVESLLNAVQLHC